MVNETCCFLCIFTLLMYVIIFLTNMVMRISKKYIVFKFVLGVYDVIAPLWLE